MIEEVVSKTTLKDPLEIAERMMSHPKLPMLGCQHAYIAAGALLSALRNEGSRKITESDLKEVFKRTERQAMGGYCGLTGVCGIVPAIGSCFSILLGSRCGKDLEQRITMEAARRVMEVIEKLTGPSCCKAYVRASLPVAVDALKEKLGISLPVKDLSATCLFDKSHPHGCRENRCPYYKKEGILLRNGVREIGPFVVK
jgi:hypothetical protein